MTVPIAIYAKPGAELTVLTLNCSEPTKAGEACKGEVTWWVMTKEGTRHPLCSSHMRVIRKRYIVTVVGES